MHAPTDPTPRHHDDESGAIAVMAAVLALAMVVATSLAVDVGRVAFTSRDQQGVTDRAALDGVRTAASSAAVTLRALHDEVAAEVADSLTRNPGTDGGTAHSRTVTSTQLGRMDATDPTLFTVICDEEAGTPAPDCDDVDAAGTFSVDDVDAVRVDTSSHVDFVLALGDATGGRDVLKSAVAQAVGLAGIRVGSQLTGLSTADSDLLDELMSELLCPALDTATTIDPTAPSSPTCVLNLGVAGWEGLANGTVTLGDLVDAPGFTVGSPQQVLDSQVTLVDLVDAAIVGLNDAGDPATIALQSIRAAIDPAATVRFGDVFALDAGQPGNVLDTQVNLLDLVRSSAYVVNGDNLIDLSLGIPGIGEVRIGAIEAPRSASGRPGRTEATTGQVRMAIDVSLPITLPVVGGATVEMPLYLEVGGGRAALTGIDCGPGPDVDPTQSLTSVHVDAESTAGRVVVGELADQAASLRGDQDLTITGPSTIIDVTVALLASVQVTASGDSTIGSSGTVPLTFTGPYATPWQSVSGSHLGLADVLFGTPPLAGGGDLAMGGSVTLLGLAALDLNTVLGSTVSQLAPFLTGTVDPLVETLTELLGLELGSADVMAQWVRCGQPILMPLQDGAVPAP